MTTEEMNAQLDNMTNVARAANAYIIAMWAAYDGKPTLVGIDPASVQPKMDESTAALADLINTVNSRPVPA